MLELADINADDLGKTADIVAAIYGPNHPATIKLDQAAVAGWNEEQDLQRAWDAA